MALELKDLQTQKLLTVTEGGMTFGREGGKAEMKLADRGVSTLHCKIVFERGGYFVEDLGSTNGTFVDGKKISERTALKAGAALALFRYRFEVLGEERRPGEEETAERILPPPPPAPEPPPPTVEEKPAEKPSETPSESTPKEGSGPHQTSTEAAALSEPATPGSSRFVTRVIVAVWLLSIAAIALMLMTRGGGSSGDKPADSTQTPTNAEDKKAEPPPPPPAATDLPPPPPPDTQTAKQVGASERSPFPLYAEKRKAIEDKLRKDASILKKKKPVQKLFKKLNDETARIERKYKPKKGAKPKVDDYVIQAEIYEATVDTVDELHRLLFGAR